MFDMESIDDVKLSHNDDTESIDAKLNINDNWSAGSERTCETESTDTLSTSSDQRNMDNHKMCIAEQHEENKQAISKIQVINGINKQNTEK